jgi:hypothetical protein
MDTVILAHKPAVPQNIGENPIDTQGEVLFHAERFLCKLGEGKTKKIRQFQA